MKIVDRFLRFRPGKYSRTIYMWIALTIFLLVLVFAATVYFNAEKALMDSNRTANRQVLSQIEYNISYTNEIIRNLCMSVYLNPDAVGIMNGDFSGDEYYDAVVRMDRIRANTLNINSFVHSIYIYNNKTRTYYSTFRGLNYQDARLQDMLRRNPLVPIRMPIFRKIDGENAAMKPEEVFTYAMYDSLDTKGRMEGAVFVNVKAQWILDNIRKINGTGDGKDDRVLLLDSRGEFIGDSGNAKVFQDALSSIYKNIDRKLRSGEALEMMPVKIEGRKYLITYIYIKSADWVVMKIQALDGLYQNVDSLKLTIVVITIVFLLIGLLVSATLSNRIYRPIGNLVREAGGQSQLMGENGVKDELGYLQEVLKRSSRDLQLSLKERNSQREFARMYYLRKLVLDSGSITEEELTKAHQQTGVCLDFHKPFCVGYIRIDNWKRFDATFSSQDKELMKFAIANIMTEVVARQFPCECIDMKHDSLVLLINVDESCRDYQSRLAILMREAQAYIMEYFKLMVTAAVSQRTSRREEITQAYNHANQNSLYRYIYGKMAVITPQMVKANTENTQFDYSFALEKKLVEEIKRGSLQNAEETLLAILNGICRLNHYNIMLSIMHLMNTLKATAYEISAVRLDTAAWDFSGFNDFMEYESIDEFHEYAMGILRRIITPGGSDGNDKHMILVGTVKDMIHANYADPGICLAQVAAALKMSPNYVGRIYKENTGLSIADYINEVRLNKAAELLQSTSVGVSQVMLRVGIENESHFYRNFKKKFGATPKEYALKKAVDGL